MGHFPRTVFKKGNKELVFHTQDSTFLHQLMKVITSLMPAANLSESDDNMVPFSAGKAKRGCRGGMNCLNDF